MSSTPKKVTEVSKISNILPKIHKNHYLYLLETLEGINFHRNEISGISEVLIDFVKIIRKCQFAKFENLIPVKT